MISFEGYAALLEEQLGQEPTDDANDYVSLVATAETLRRARDASETKLEVVERALAAYDDALPSWSGAAPTELREELIDALTELRASIDDDEPTGAPSELLGRVDELIQVAVAAARIGALSDSLPNELGELARSEVASFASVAAHLWQAAEDRAAWLGADSQAGPYAWIDELARLSPTRLALAAGPPLFTSADKQSMLEGFLRRRAAESTRSDPATASAWQVPGVRAWADELAAEVARTEAVDVSRSQWDSGPVALAESAKPTETDAGRVRLPVVLEGGERAAIVTLIIRQLAPGESGGSWAGSERLRSVARGALRNAFLVAAEQMPWRLPPGPFDAYAFELETPADVAAVDGASLGAPAVAAFLSLWTKQPLPADFVATGLVIPGCPNLLAVGGIEAKHRAVRALRGALLRLPKPNVSPEFEADVEAIPTIAELVVATGVQLPNDDDYCPWLGERPERIAQLETMVRDVRLQHLTDYQRAREDPWAVLADRMCVLITSLESDPAGDQRGKRTCAEARSYAALAYTHAADGSNATAVLHGSSRDGALPLAARLLAEVVALSASIDDDEADKEAHFDAVSSLLDQADEADLALLRGQAIGTQGRLRMHQRRLDEALPLLTEAVAHHETYDPYEAPRSQIYVATAQRMNGDLDAALATLTKARQGLDTTTAQFSAYAATTRVYLEYELARTLLAAKLPSAAAVAARHADRQARDLGLSWPRHGILRTLAWAQAAMGRPKTAVIEMLASLVGSQPDSLFEPFLEEAKGEHRDDGEVY